MPLDKFKAAILRVTDQNPDDSAFKLPSKSAVHPLHQYIRPWLLNTRSCTEKWTIAIPNLLMSEEGSGSAEDEMMWFALKFEKSDDPVDGEQGTEEPWQEGWLRRMERRESVSSRSHLDIAANLHAF